MNCSTCSTPLICPRCTRSAQVKAGLDRAAKQGRRGGRKGKYGEVSINQVNHLRLAGHSFAEIARLMGVPKSTCHRMVRDAS